MSQDKDEQGASGSDSESAQKSKRNFLKTALATGVVLLVAGVAAVTKSLWTPGGPSGLSFPKFKVANVSELQASTPVFFDYPLVGESNMLVKLGQSAVGGVGPQGDIVAFSVVCQHLGCIVGYQAQGASPSCDPSYKASGPVGYCCCHGSIYDLTAGAKVVGGPAPRPQPQVTLQYEAGTGNIYAVGMGPPTIFGHQTGSSDVSADLQGGTLVS